VPLLTRRRRECKRKTSNPFGSPSRLPAGSPFAPAVVHSKGAPCRTGSLHPRQSIPNPAFEQSNSRRHHAYSRCFRQIAATERSGKSNHRFAAEARTCRAESFPSSSAYDSTRMAHCYRRCRSCSNLRMLRLSRSTALSASTRVVVTLLSTCRPSRAISYRQPRKVFP
jgi:hypothetical protein